ncbi:MAG: heme ABC transporter ATP-binding protein [Spongiibacteraceae bacterium]
MRAENLRIERDTRTVLENISLQLHSGEVLGVLGANGAGKSTLLGVLAGELPIASGSIEIGNVPLHELSMAQLARQRAVLPQASTLNFDLAVNDVVAMGAYPFPEASPQQVAVQIQRALMLTDTLVFQQRRYLHLSGGEQQRVQLARTLVQIALSDRDNTRYLLLDEPTASLDPRHQQDLLRVVRQLAETENIAVLTVLHDVNLAARWCHRLLLLAHGNAVACGTPREVLQPALLRDVYAMDVSVLPHPCDAVRPLVLFE